ncbi:MAG: queuosine precursor transporter [Legionellales bacterium]|nr:queuosine precursor transporter [Legionellales bacterium]
MSILTYIAEAGAKRGRAFSEKIPFAGYTFITPIGMLFVSCLIVANITAQKPIHIFFFNLPGGALIFPFLYIIANIVTEVYGYKWTRFLIWISLLCNILVLLYTLLTVSLPGASFWSHQADYQTTLGFVPLIIVASGISYLSGEYVNSYALSKLKILMKGRHLWSRVILSTAVGSVVDSFVFIPFVFFNTATLYEMCLLGLSLSIIKVGYEVLAIPLTYYAVNFLKTAEKSDVYDFNTKFTPFSMDLYYSDKEKNGATIIQFKQKSSADSHTA